MMLSLLSYCFLTAFAAVTAAAPNPAVGYMIDVVTHKPSKTLSSPLITSSSIEIGGVLSARNKAAGPLIDDGVDIHRKAHSTHSSSISPSSASSSFLSPSSSLPSSSSDSSSNSSASGTLVISLCDSLVTLAPRDPAVGPVYAFNEHRITKTTRSSATSTAIISVNPDCNLIAALGGNQPGVLPRDPAFNIINAVGDGVPNESVLRLAGGSPVTLAANDVDRLNAVASEIPIPIAPFPSVNAVFSVAASPTNGLPASLYDLPAPTSTGVMFDVAGTNTELYLYSDPKQPINKLSMGQVLAEAISELRTLVTKPNTDGWLPTSEWTYVRHKWDCIVTVERNIILGPKGLPQHLTYGILLDTMVGLWGALFSKGVYHGTRFEILDSQWGFVGSGSIAPWVNGTLPSLLKGKVPL